MKRAKNILAAMALSGMAACSADKVTEQPVNGSGSSPEVTVVDPALENAVSQANMRVNDALNSSSSMVPAMVEDASWRAVIAGLPETERQNLNRIGRLMLTSGSTPEFEDYLMRLMEIDAQTTDFYNRGLLNQASFDTYMDVRADLSAKLESIEGCIGRECGLAEDRQYYQDEADVIRRILRNPADGQPTLRTYRDRNPLYAIFSSDEQELYGLNPASFTRMTRTPVSPYVTSSIMLEETFPHGEYTNLARYAIAIAMLNSGYEPNLKPARGNSHLTTAYPCITYPIGARLYSELNERNSVPAELRLPEFESEADFYYNMVHDSHLGTQAFQLLAQQNRNAFENTVHQIYPRGTEEYRRIRDEFMNTNSESHEEAYMAISIYLHNEGAKFEKRVYLLELIIQSGYSPDEFVRLLTEQHAYTANVLRRAHFMEEHPELFDRYRPADNSEDIE